MNAGLVPRLGIGTWGPIGRSNVLDDCIERIEEVHGFH